MQRESLGDNSNSSLDSALLINLVELVGRVGIERELTNALNRVAEEVTYLFEGTGALVALAQEDGLSLELTIYGQDLTDLKWETESLDQPYELAGQAVAEGRPAFSNDLKNDPRFNEIKIGKLRRGIAVPLHWPEGCIGALAIYRGTSSSEFSERDRRSLEYLGKLLGPLLGQLRRVKLLEQGVDARDDFLSVASHDLRNPLSSMRGFTQLITRIIEKTGPDQPLPRERIQNYLVRIVRQADQLNDLIEKVLDFSRILNNRLELNLSEVELGELVQNSVTRFQNWLVEQERDFESEKQHILELTPSSENLTGRVDAGRLGQLVNNLLHNAIKYSPDGGSVNIRLYRQDSQIYLDIKDPGVGISPEKQSSVFQRWKVPGHFRESGLGVSLFIAKDLAVRHGGDLNFESTPGAGSTFTLKLPLSNRQSLV